MRDFHQAKEAKTTHLPKNMYKASTLPATSTIPLFLIAIYIIVLSIDGRDYKFKTLRKPQVK